MSVDLSFIDWAAEFSGDINYNVNRFNTILYSLLDKHVPSKAVKPILLPIWYDHECESARVRKENLRNRWKDCKSQTDYDNYKAARSHFKHRISRPRGAAAVPAQRRKSKTGQT